MWAAREVALPFSVQVEPGTDAILSAQFAEFTVRLSMATTAPLDKSSGPTLTVISVVPVTSVRGKLTDGAEQILGFIEPRVDGAATVRLDVLLPVFKQSEIVQFKLRVRAADEKRGAAKYPVTLHGTQSTLLSDKQIKVLQDSAV